MTDEERDAAAEAWLCARHRRDWYIGEGTSAEWAQAYAAVDAEAAVRENNEPADQETT